MAAKNRIEILLVADNAGGMAIEAFKNAEIPNHVSVVRDGKEARAFLRTKGDCLRALRPEFILLGLNMLKKDGGEGLREVKTTGALKAVPFIVLTTSATPTDIVQGDDLYANGYIQKRDDFDEFLELIRPLDTLWFSVVQLPPAIEGATA
jgi:two-component system, chemotaxis family, response regulator Rcp1